MEGSQDQAVEEGAKRTRVERVRLDT